MWGFFVLHFKAFFNLYFSFGFDFFEDSFMGGNTLGTGGFQTAKWRHRNGRNNAVCSRDGGEGNGDGVWSCSGDFRSREGGETDGKTSNSGEDSVSSCADVGSSCRSSGSGGGDVSGAG